MLHRAISAAGSVCLLATMTNANILGFVESFDAGPANWRNFNSSADLEWSAAGGPDGSAYASSVFNLSGTTVGGFPPTVIRAHANFNSSNSAYVGDWIAAGVTGVSFDFRHNLSEALTITGRFATPNNQSGASIESTVLIPGDVWTTIFVDLTPNSSDFISFGNSNYNAIFSNIGNIQLGFNVPVSLAGQNIDARFDIDNFRIVPAPASALLMVPGLLACVRRRR
ncbi:MAG: hypothetical protein KF757_08525 [Phycisphaeraceae bacterium]|nr:hypothetical protein [Phycisphaeraceae bacterium]MCW5762798.1 hypothetical protein [Phycisphaeraceae bacterium]